MSKLFLLLLLGAMLAAPAETALNQSDDEHANYNTRQMLVVPILEDKPGHINFIAETKSHPTTYAEGNHGEGKKHHGIHVADFRWDEIGIYITFTAFVIVAGLAKVAFHHAHFISSRIPESCAAGFQGSSQQAGLTGEESFMFPTFTPKLFFFFLLPPIILEASYSLYDRAFADNTGTVLFYAVTGTIFNTFVIGLCLIGLVTIGWIGAVHISEGTSMASLTDHLYTLKPTDCLVFSALISAVDPVAVLAIFQEIGINKDLYFLVFGESLLNDAVTVVLYAMMVAFAQMEGNVGGEQYVLGFVSFFTISLGGFGIGILCGLLTALITRTTSEVRVVEPLVVFGMAYFAYMGAELFHFSGIISCIGCGLVQAHYAFPNISRKSHTTVKYFIKMLSSTSDCIIFLFLGMVLVNDVHEWHTGFVLWTLLLCLVVRFLGVVMLTTIANRFRLKPVNLREQFIMAYGGLRGAVSFSLVEMLLPSVILPRQMFVTTTLVVVLFTVFIQGGTIKLFVHLLDIKKDSQSVKYLINEMNETLFDHLSAGFEGICGQRGNNFLRGKIEQIDERYLRPIFTRRSEKDPLQLLFEKLTLSEHEANMYNIGGKTRDFATTELPGTDESLMISELMKESTTSLSSAGSVRMSSLLQGASTYLGHMKQQERKSLRRFVDAVGMLRQKSAPPENLILPQVSKSASRRSVSLDPEVTAHVFRKALRTNSSNQSRRLFEKRNLIKDDDLPDPSKWMSIRRRVSKTSDTLQPGDRFAQTVLSVMNSELPKPKGRFAQTVGTVMNTQRFKPGTSISPLATFNVSSSNFDNGTNGQQQLDTCFTENECSSTLESNKQSGLGNTTGLTAPLEVIIERDKERSRSSTHTQDSENDEEQGAPLIMAKAAAKGDTEV
ncbi:Na(+)/H(+) exchanger protein 7-like isoform X2 [Daphnia carinata]|uniref:Na(+)/H(+) exchanger protein 7-like isoform X2 n=1 Tax=Daphnia carinata TaxID=120202 RepID=UPI0028694882|nr:Na(+)/H(+) exchanger protein 7-like isoform X2 [Daphnia carinata]